jgi:hypothetical protein
VAARATLKAKVDIERAAQPARNALIKAFVKFLHFTFEHSPEALADFGLTPPKAPRTLTAEEKAVATARREATRAARGTKGPRARQKVKGNVDVNVVVTPQAPAEPATPAAPAQGGGTATQK